MTNSTSLGRKCNMITTTDFTNGALLKRANFHASYMEMDRVTSITFMYRRRLLTCKNTFG